MRRERRGEELRSIEVTQMPASGEVASAWITRHGRQSTPAELTWNMHQAFEIEVVLNGLHERRYGDLALELGPGDLSLVPAWEPHGYRSLSREGAVLVIFFVPSFLGEEMVGDASWLGLFLSEPEDRARPHSEATRRRVLEIAGELVREVEEQGSPGWLRPGPDSVLSRGGAGRGEPAAKYWGVVVKPQGSAEWLTVMRLAVLRLLFAVARDWAPPDGGEGAHHGHFGDLARVAPAARLVGSHPAQRVSLEEAAAVCGLSASRFGAVFRRAMGMSFGQFALRSRLAQAAQLMLSTEAPLEAIAEQTGFGGASHLHHAFTKCYACTPAAYRRQTQP
jgi:AraC-like DNA-binding protein